MVEFLIINYNHTAIVNYTQGTGKHKISHVNWFLSGIKRLHVNCKMYILSIFLNGFLKVLQVLTVRRHLTFSELKDQLIF